VPRVLLSDGTEPAAETPDAPGETSGTLRGKPASGCGGRSCACDPGAQRRQPAAGGILFAPSTDPGWTPIFLTAGGLVIEMVGAMLHGAVLAREYGIPAVVGVPDATERIATGQRITVDGSAGTSSTQPQSGS